eukprot:UN12859
MVCHFNTVSPALKIYFFYSSKFLLKFNTLFVFNFVFPVI